jgi:hypothetical protein
VLVVVMAALVTGCAGRNVGTPKSLTDADRPLLAGTWQGTMVGATGASLPATLRVNSDGTHTLQGGPSSSQGKAEIRDGEMQFVATSAVSRAAAGPYHFEFSKPK